MQDKATMLLMDYAKELAHILDQLGHVPQDDFERGRKSGLAEAASLLIEEARSFDASANEIDLTILTSRTDIL